MLSPHHRDDVYPLAGLGRTSKTPIIGVVERGGRVVARVAHSLKGNAILQFICSAVISEPCARLCPLP